MSYGWYYYHGIRFGGKMNGENILKSHNQNTHQVMVGNVPIGGGAPVAVQSMLNCPAEDAQANIDQVKRLVDYGCEIVRMTVPNDLAVEAFENVCKASPIPVVADIHFRADLAIKAIKAGASKIRINPGNLGGLDKTDEVIDVAKQFHVPIRIGVNAGSLDEKLKARTDLSLPEKLAASVTEYAQYFYSKNFKDIVLSAKAHDVQTTLEAYRQISKSCPRAALHIGVTEAGGLMQGCIKSASGLGILLNEGIGDTLRISLTEDPALEVKAAWQLLGALDLRRRGVEIISCPTCGRTKVNMIEMAKKVEEGLAGNTKPIKVAVMGCIVNGPGEAQGADIGVACGKGNGVIFKDGVTLCKVPEEEIVSSLLEQINNL